MLDLRNGRVTAVPDARTGIVLDTTWTPGGLIAYLHPPRTGTEGRSLPTGVYTIRADGSGKRRRFLLPHDQRDGMWAPTLTWRRAR